MLEFLRIAAGGIIIGVVTGKILAGNPTHIDRLKPNVWIKKLRKMDREKWIRLFGWSATTIVACFLITGLIGGLLENKNIQIIRPEEDLAERMAKVSKAGLALLILLLPILEEWVFRAIFIDEMLSLGVSKAESILVPAFGFAAFHLSNPGAQPAIILTIFPAGVLLGICYLKTGLFGSIISHSSYNLLVFLLKYL